MGIDIRLNIGTEYSQRAPSVAALANGTFVAVWEDTESDPGFDGFTGVVGGIFSASGQPLGPQFRVNVEGAGQQFGPMVTASGAGFVVAWGSDGPQANGAEDPYIDLWTRRYDASGRPITGEVQIAGSQQISHYPQDVATLSDGSIVVVSASEFGRTDWEIVAHRFSPAGVRLGPSRLLHEDAWTGTGGTAFVYPRPGATVTPLADGDYLLTYYEGVDRPGGGGGYLDFSIMGRRFNADGTPAGPLRQVTPAADFDPTIDREYASAALLANGTVAVAWTADPFSTDADLDRFVEFRIVSADGVPLTPIVRVAGGSADGDQIAQDVISLGQGYSLVTFMSYNEDVSEFPYDYYDLRGRVFGPGGQPLGAEFNINQFAYEDAYAGSATRLADGRIVFAWSDGVSIEEDVYATILGPNAIPQVRQGGAGADVIAGGPAANLILAGTGNDRAAGGEGADAVFGESGADLLLGEGGADRVVGGLGADDLRGGTGVDRLEGGPERDTLYGGDGVDVLLGGGAGDILAGGAGADAFVFDDGDLGRGALADRIADMGAGEGGRPGGDRINLSLIDAVAGTPADDAFRWIGAASFSGRAGELRFVAGGIISGDVNGDRLPDIQLVAPGFQASDLIL